MEGKRRTTEEKIRMLREVDSGKRTGKSAKRRISLRPHTIGGGSSSG